MQPKAKMNAVRMDMTDCVNVLHNPRELSTAMSPATMNATRMDMTNRVNALHLRELEKDSSRTRQRYLIPH